MTNRPLSQLQPHSVINSITSDDYNGEWINVELSKDRIDRRFISPQLDFVNPSGNAICLGNGLSRSHYSLEKFYKTNQRKIVRYYNVMYSCNASAFEWTPDFLIVTNQLLAAKVSKDLHSIMYSNQEIMRRYPNSNLIPQNLRMDAGSLAVYLAAFHGAKKVYLYGYDGQNDSKQNNNIYSDREFYDKDPIDDHSWATNLYSIISAYDQVQFYHVGSPTERYKQLNRLLNYKIIKFQDFISLADL